MFSLKLWFIFPFSVIDFWWDKYPIAWNRVQKPLPLRDLFSLSTRFVIATEEKKTKQSLWRGLLSVGLEITIFGSHTAGLSTQYHFLPSFAIFNLLAPRFAVTLVYVSSRRTGDHFPGSTDSSLESAEGPRLTAIRLEIMAFELLECLTLLWS